MTDDGVLTMNTAAAPSQISFPVPQGIHGTRAALFHLWRKPDNMPDRPLSVPYPQIDMIAGTVTARFSQSADATVRIVPLTDANPETSMTQGDKSDVESAEARRTRLSATLMDDIFIF